MKHPPQEADLVPGGKIAAVTIGVIVATIAGVLVAYGIGACTTTAVDTRWMSGSPPPMPPEVNAMEATVFTTEAQGMELHGRAERYLREYGWIDRERQIVRVPIEVAYELYLARQRGGQR